jgi:hypothetical protein
MESTPGDREHGYDDVQEEQAYENAEQAEDPDAGPASQPGEVQPDQAEGEPEDV